MKQLLEMIQHFRKHAPKKKQVTLIVLFVLICSGCIFVFFRPSPTATPAKEPVIETPAVINPPFPPADESLAHEISGNEVTLIDSSEKPLLSLTLKDTLFVITNHALVNEETKESLSLPESVQPVRLASAMNDLNALFLYGADQNMYIYYPNAKSLVQNTFPLPNDFTLSDMGTYLTYLYAFDATKGRILRFPRAEGGFGAPTEWLKESVVFDEHAIMSIGENILIGSKDTVFSYSKGRGGKLTLKGTKTPTNIQDMAIHTDGSFSILDTVERRIIHFDTNGGLLGQYFNTQFSSAEAFHKLKEKQTFLIILKDKILSLDMY